MTDRFLRGTIIGLLFLASAYVLQPYVVSLWSSATAPRAITPRGDLTEMERATIGIFRTVSPSVVHVFARTRPRDFFSFEPEESMVQTGSGIVWDAAGHVITNYHVIKGTDQLGARLHTGETVSARVVGTAPNYDLAVLQLERPHSALHPIMIGSSSDLEVGQSAFAIGNPYGLEQTLTAGIVSALRRKIPTATGHEIAGGVQTDAPLNPGNSGGPLLDSAGRLIGVNSVIISGSGASAGVGIAIPVDVVNRVAAQLIAKGHVPVPGIGIVTASAAASAQLGIDGVVILQVRPNSPAAKAGLEGIDRASGRIADTITAAAGQPVHDVTDLATVFERFGVGKTVRLTIVRNGTSRFVDVTLADVSGYSG